MKITSNSKAKRTLRNLINFQFDNSQHQIEIITFRLINFQVTPFCYPFLIAIIFDNQLFACASKKFNIFYIEFPIYKIKQKMMKIVLNKKEGRNRKNILKEEK